MIVQRRSRRLSGGLLSPRAGGETPSGQPADGGAAKGLGIHKS